MRSLWVVLAVVVQIAVLAGMVYGRESLVLNGERIFLRTMPIDPRDPFRGDFVRLRYAMNNASNMQVRWVPDSFEPKAGKRVYAVLKKSVSSLHHVSYLTNVKPESELFIRGKIDSHRGFVGFNSRFNTARTTVKYGIEQLFVEQGKGVEIEVKQGLRGGAQVPLEVEVAVGDNGSAVVTNYRWGSLGMDLQFISSTNVEAGEESQLDANGRVISPATTFVLQMNNVSDDAVILNNPGENCGFTIVPADNDDHGLRPAQGACAVQTEPVFIELLPGESYFLHVNLAEPRWFVESDELPAADLRSIGAAAFYRVLYQSVEISDASAPESLWIGSLESRMFHGSSGAN